MTPGDQHFFGVSMVERFLRGGGWDVDVELDATIEHISAAVEERWFAIAGLSLGSEVRLDNLTETIAAIRRSSQNRSIGIMVGGPLFAERPNLASSVGADATAINGPAAVVVAQRLLEAATCSNQWINECPKLGSENWR